MFSDNFRRGEETGKGKKGSKAVSKLADISWKAFQTVNKALPEGKSIQPNWAAEPLLKSYERTAPPLGFPRETDSLCPKCVKHVREGVINQDIPLEILMNSHPGEIKAQIVEEMHKTASLSEWYQEHGRHAVYAKGKEVPNIAKTRSLSLPVIAKVLQEDLDKPVVTPYLVEEEKHETVSV